MNIRFLYILAVMFAILSVGGCNCATDDSKKQEEGLAQASKIAAEKNTPDQNRKGAKALLSNTSWKLSFLADRGDAPMPPENSENAVRMFINADMRVNGYSGDNFFGGGLTLLDSGFFKLTNLYSTRRAGPYGLCEYKFLTALGKIDRFELEGEKLKLFHGKNLLLEFKKDPSKQGNPQ